jgi:PAS domain S-box-containing protein
MVSIEQSARTRATSAELVRLGWTNLSVADAVITTDTEGAVTFLNPAANYLTGWTLDEALGKPLRSVFVLVDESGHRALADTASQVLQGAITLGRAPPMLLMARDRTERLIEGDAAPIRDMKENVIGVAILFKDTSGRRPEEQLVYETLRFAERIIANIHQPFLVLDRELHVRAANPAFCRTFHMSLDEVLTKVIYRLAGSQWNAPLLHSLLDSALSTDPVASACFLESEFESGGKKIMLLNARPFDGAGHEPPLILLTIEDITERKQAEVALQTSELQYRRLFQSAKDGILVLDAITLNIIDANPFITDLLGYSRDELLGRELWEIGFFADKPSSQAMYQELQECGYVRYDHLPLRTKHGRTAEVEFICNVYPVGGRAVAQCNIRDISERSSMERRMQEQAEALADLHRRKDEFLAMLSHELRNPLAPIANAVHLLRLQESDDPIQQKARVIIERQVLQLTRLIDDLMEVSRITTGRVLLRNEIVDVNGVVEHAVETTRSLTDQREQRLTVSLSQQPIWLSADAARLEQVMVNLLTNAAKYTDDGGQIWLTVSKEGSECVIRLLDTGVGIAQELLPRIFDLFAQADHSLARSSGGLGIGLALVRRLVEMHGGRVEAFSALGRGSEFVVRLPTVPAPITAPDINPTKNAERATHNLRVLIVDDNADTTDSLALIVELMGHTVFTARDGLAAVREASAHCPDVVLLDIGLPGLSGYEVARWIGQQASLSGAVLVAITGYGQESDRQLALEAGFDYHLVKPVDFGKIEEILVNAAIESTLPPSRALPRLSSAPVGALTTIPVQVR